MRKKKVLSSRELETEKFLQAALPEYIIRANMRLADVVHAGNQFKYMSGYHLDFVICDVHANTIAAVELDDSTHDTEEGKRRDANKNKWLDEAKITLIRIRKPEDALTIREKLKLPESFNISHENRPTFMRPKQKNQVSGYIKNLVALIAITGLVMWALNSITQKMLSDIGKNSIAQQQRVQQTQAAENWRKQQEAEKAEARRKIEAQQPHYERVLVKGKSARECSNGNVINNETILCMKDHYETVLVSGAQ